MASRKEQKEAARRERERKEAEARSEAARKRRAQIIAGAVALIAVAGAAVAIAAVKGGGTKKDQNVPTVPLATAAKQAGCTVVSRPAEGHQHTAPPYHYKLNPPASGNHDPVPASDGEYTSPPGIGHLVHAQEHGRVILWYKPGTPSSIVSQLRTIFNQTSSLEILTPNNTNMPFQVAASAWTGDRATTTVETEHMMGCPKWTPQVGTALRAFIAQYKGQGPERIMQPE